MVTLSNESTSETIPATMDEIASEPEVNLHALTNASNLRIFRLAATYGSTPSRSSLT